MQLSPLVRPIHARGEWLRQLAYEDPRTFPVLLDSAASGPLGRHTILAAYPQASLCLTAGGRLLADTHGREWDRDLPRTADSACSSKGFLETLERAFRVEALGRGPAPVRDALPFCGGWMLFLSYEMAAEVEPQLQLPQPTEGTAPRALALRVPAAVTIDEHSGDAWLIAEADRPELLDDLQQRLAGAATGAGSGAASTGALPSWQLEEEPSERYLWRVRRALDYIAAGDIYQANLARPWRARFQSTAQSHGALAAGLYERLRRANPAPFAGLLQRADWSLLCSSPERLVRVVAGEVQTRPIAGTRARSRREGQDPQELAALIAHPKERAEHVMLVDLERNDLGRICEAGSVSADPMLFTESYAHVHHIVSNVSGRLRSGLTPVDVLRAVFPGGTITGCPKFRCMQIIAELEGEPRGAYTGALGYINHDGSMDLNILIRTLTLQPGVLELRAGAGIVADSDPLRELEETRAKARGLLAALQTPP